MILQEASMSEILACEAPRRGSRTDKAVGAMAAMLRTIVKNAIEHP
jgi:hypothetical protein